MIEAVTGPTVAVAWNDLKGVSLYFDQVLPIGDYDRVPRSIRFDYQAIRDTYLFLPTEYYVPGKTAWQDFEEAIHRRPYAPAPDEVPISNDWVLSACVALRRLGVKAVPILGTDMLGSVDWRLHMLDPSYYEADVWADSMDEPDEPGWPTLGERRAAVLEVAKAWNETEYLEVAFRGLPRVQAEDVGWSRITRFREDPETAELFQRFHLSLERDARGKDADYVRRLVQDRLAIVRRGARRHRVELAEETVRTLLNAKSLVAGALTAVTGYLDRPGVAIGLGAGVATEVTITMLKQRRSRANWLHGSELGYAKHVEDEFS